MTNDEARVLLAERIMGWHLRDSDEWPEWLDKEGDMVCETPDWHPDTDLMQAMMVAETLRQKGVSVELRFHAKKNWRTGATIEGPAYSCRMAPQTAVLVPVFRRCGLEGEAQYDADTLPRAIFLAAAQVAEAMGAES